MDDENFQFAIRLPPNFPLHDLLMISKILTEADICVAGYIPPPVGLYDVGGHFYDHSVRDVQTILLPDRNIASRFAKLAQGKILDNLNQRKVLAALLAYAQCLDILIEPSIAFHELAHQQGNESALTELAWFRTADNAEVYDLMDVALERKDRLNRNYQPQNVEHKNLAFPLKRWNRNYIICLKMMELEHTVLKPIDRIFFLMKWMESDFIFGGPAAILASVYSAPKSPPKAGVFKGKNSPNRKLAIAGAKNQAWDITQLSDFSKLINENSDSRKHFLFASFDKQLRLLAQLLLNFRLTKLVKSHI